ncbi:sphingomyelin phosphodiesterase 5-like isoform X1 [Patiria miniata]|uniref:sphingomyelin phosphodiesterase n=2 Tax=Patiria miniata TaxID=46514 RepID=A0A914AU90_PATMI|nr:sphingomyelin phosphodiesterase 5-like isoform X1 [Patiria miniata]XP_038067631.1 sphingomyelin phosphodiesterase 5-like isoform X1 [Patiria miniata]
MLYKTAFRSKHNARMYSVAYGFMLPWIWSVNRLLSLVIRTTDESRNEEEAPCYERCVILLFSLPVCLALIIAFSPFALFGFIARVYLASKRAPYMYSFADTPSRVNVNECIWADLSSKHFFKLAVIDTCLMPEGMSRLNNLRNVQTRSVNLARRIINSQVRPSPRIFVQSPSDSELKTYSIHPPASTNPMSLFNVGESNQLDVSDAEVSCVTYTNILPEETSFFAQGTDKIRDNCENGEPIHQCNGDTPLTPDTPVNGDMLRDSRDADQDSRNDPLDNLNSVPDIVPKDISDTPTPSESLASTPNLDCSIQIEVPITPFHEPKPHTLTGGPQHQKLHSENKIGDVPSPSEHAVNINFPAGLDFICFQEVFERRAAKKLVKTLHLWFSHIIYDVGVDSWRINRHFLNSGLLFASRYPILDAAFECFSQSQNEDRAVSKGLLMVKVQVGKTREGHPVVGYIAVTQLQAAQETNIRSGQLDCILNWLSSFHSNTHTEYLELVAFDLLCGNFNFDNMSPGDMPDWSHPVFLIYHDPCRQRPGLDRAWTVGTILRKKRLQDEEVCTPEGLQSALEDPQQRGNYLEDAEVFEAGGEAVRWGASDSSHYEGVGRRRVDYILYSNHRTHMQQLCEEYSFVSQLATLTDHVPLSMTFSTAIGPGAMQEWPQAVTPDSNGSHSCKIMYETTV